MRNALKTVEAEYNALGSKLTSAGTRLTGALTLPIVGVIAGSAKAAIDFESSFAGVRKTVDATEPELARLALQFREMATRLPLSASAINAVGEAAGALGIKKENIVSFTETMVKLGATTNLTADDAATSMARFSNIMQVPQGEVANLGSALVALGNDGASTEREIVDMALRIAGAGRTIGLTSGDVLGLSNALSSVGIEAEMGGSAISKVMINIASAASQGGGAIEKFARVAGMTSTAFAQLVKNDPGAAMQKFIAGLGRVKETGGDLLGTLQGLDITETRMRDTMLRVANAGTLVADSMKLGNRAFAENTALGKEFEQRQKTTAAQLQVLKNQIVDVGIELGGALIPIIKDAIGLAKPMIAGLAEAVKWFGELPTPVKMTALAIAGVVAAIGPLLVIGGTLISTIGSIAGALALIAPASATVAAGATTASLATAGLSVAMRGLFTVAAPVAAFFAGWKFGGWIGEITGATDAVGKFAARLFYGKAAADEYARSRAFATANAGTPTAAGAPPPLPGLPSVAPTSTPPAASGGDKFNPLAGMEDGKSAKSYAKAIEEIRRATIPLTESQKEFALRMQESSVGVETTAKALRIGKDAVEAYLDSVKNGKEIADTWAKAHEKMLDESKKFIAKSIADTNDLNRKIADARAEALVDQLQAMNEFQERNYQLTLTSSQRNVRAIQLEHAAEVASLKKKFDADGPLYEAAKAQIDAFYQNQIDVANQTYGTLEQRLAEQGIFSKQVLDEQAERAEVDYEQMRASGLYTAQQLEEAFAKWRDADIASGQQWVSSWVTGLGSIASALSSLGGKTGQFGSSLGGIVSNLKTASEANKKFGGSLGVASGMFSDNATGAEKWASAVQSGAAIAGGAMDVWSATANKGSKSAGAMAGAMSGAKAGAAFGPWGMAIGAVAGALVGFIRNMNAGRKAVEDFAKSAGGFDALHKELNALGAEGEKLWIKLTQQTPKGDAKAAAAVIAEVKAAIEANKALDAAISSMGFKTRAELTAVSETARKVFEKMTRDGTYSAAQLTRAWANYQAALADEASGGMASAAAAAGYQSVDELKALSSQAVALWKYMRDSGKYSAEQVADAWKKAQEASAAAGDEAAKRAVEAQKAVNDLDAELKQLNDSIAGEAVEDEMGVVEKLTRERIKAVQEQRDAAQKALDDAAAAATANAEEQSTAQQKMFNSVTTAVDRLTAAIDRIPRDVSLTVHTKYTSDGQPGGDGEPPIPDGVPGAADGVFASRPVLRVFGEGGEPELGGPVDFMRDALVGAISAIGAKGGSGGGDAAGLTLVLQANDTGELKSYVERTFMPMFLDALRRNAGGSTSDLANILQSIGL